jgi:hypothetical protein
MLSRRLLAVVIVLAAALFVVGVTRERSSEDNHAEKPAASISAEASEGSVEGEAHATKEHGRDRVLGVDAESTPLVASAVVVSLALALGVWLALGGSTLLVLVTLAMLAFAVLDLREVVHQLNENREGIAAIAAVVAVLHLGAVALAGSSLRAAPA